MMSVSLEKQWLVELSDILMDKVIGHAWDIRRNKVFPALAPMIQKHRLDKDEQFELYQTIEDALVTVARDAYMMGGLDFANITEEAKAYDFE